MILKINVPATSANIGPGFDVAGMAFNLYNHFTFDFNHHDVSFEDPKYDFDTSLTLDTFYNVLDRFNKPHPKGVKLITTTNIPVSRGLGSSSTCIVAGVMAANTYASLNLSKHECAHLAALIEGHPDNVAPAVFGNLNVALMDDTLHILNQIIHPDYGFIALIPKHKVSTEAARSILPKTVSLKDLTYTQSRSVFLLESFRTFNPTLIKTVIHDIIHEPYRKELIQEMGSIAPHLEKEPILTYWVSGAGPTLMALTHINDTKAIADRLSDALEDVVDVMVLQVDNKGAIIE